VIFFLSFLFFWCCCCRKFYLFLFIVRNAKEEEKKNSVKTIVFTDFPLSDFALRAFCRLQKQKTSMTLRIFLSRGRRAFFSFFSLLASHFFFHNAHLFPSLFFYSRRRCALTTTALNLLPVGQLDGGRIAQAAFGRRVLSATSLGTYLGLTFGILGSTLSLPWLLFIVICQRTPDYAPKDDVTEVGESRATLAFACIAIAFLILLPGSSLVPSDLGPLDF